jgi:cell wall-associated NlpC family hydrolase
LIALSLDPRITPVRPDLAAEHLRGTVEAARFAEGMTQEVILGTVPLRKEPSHQAALLTEALCGERITVYEIDDEGWAWGQLKSDSYVGFLPAAALLAPKGQPTHKVSALRTFVYPGPSIKLPPTDALPLGARLVVVRTEGDFAVTVAGGYVVRRHLAPVSALEMDFVAVAEWFIGTSYLWGGKSSLGIDCSGLVQVALNACGRACPRDSDMQEAFSGTTVSLAELRRGDLLFWQGHVAIARSASSVIHANAYHMAVAIEPVTEAIARIASAGSEVTSIRRLK